MIQPLGKMQKNIIECLLEHGNWKNSAIGGWNWDTQSQTRRIIFSLVRRDIAELVDDWGSNSYRLTRHGVAEGIRLFPDAFNSKKDAFLKSGHSYFGETQ